MKNKIISVFVLLICLLSCKKIESQTTNKSNKILEKKEQFKEKSTIHSFSFSLLSKDSDDRPTKVKIEIKQNNKITQIINYIPSTWPTVITHFIVNQIDYFNKDVEIQEGIENYNDFIIADFNFDNREDFAILYDVGGNGGPFYSYYFQNEKGDFKVDESFPLNQGYFPKDIDSINHTLTMITPVGCCKIATTIIKIDRNNKWKVISEKEEDMN